MHIHGFSVASHERRTRVVVFKPFPSSLPFSLAPWSQALGLNSPTSIAGIDQHFVVASLAPTLKLDPSQSTALSVGLSRVPSSQVAQEAYKILRARLQELLVSAASLPSTTSGGKNTLTLGDDVLHALLVVLRSNEVRRV